MVARRGRGHHPRLCCPGGIALDSRGDTISGIRRTGLVVRGLPVRLARRAHNRTAEKWPDWLAPRIHRWCLRIWISDRAAGRSRRSDCHAMDMARLVAWQLGLAALAVPRRPVASHTPDGKAAVAEVEMGTDPDGGDDGCLPFLVCFWPPDRSPDGTAHVADPEPHRVHWGSCGHLAHPLVCGALCIGGRWVGRDGHEISAFRRRRARRRSSGCSFRSSFSR